MFKKCGRSEVKSTETVTVNNHLYSDKINLQIFLEAIERVCLDALGEICIYRRYTENMLL
jgi:hypothetical protein